MAVPFVAEIRMFTGNFAPIGWAQCDGATLDQAQNSDLFSIIGTTYGGDAINFNLPDIRGRVPIHAGQGPGLANYNLGATGGVENVTLTESQLPSHSHNLVAHSGVATSRTPGGNFVAQASAGAAYNGTGHTVAMDPATVAPAPAITPHSTMAPYLAINFIIALFGVYPSPN